MHLGGTREPWVLARESTKNNVLRLEKPSFTIQFKLAKKKEKGVGSENRPASAYCTDISLGRGTKKAWGERAIRNPQNPPKPPVSHNKEDIARGLQRRGKEIYT